MGTTARPVTAVVLALLALGGGCGGGDDGAGSVSTQAELADPAPTPGPAEPLTASHCPPGLPDCRATEGRIVFVERVDPDGDGDAHFVIDDPRGITVDGMTFIDVRRGLRPHPLPGIGERISAAGPVQTGSYGQSQIHAIELHVAGE